MSKHPDWADEDLEEEAAYEQLKAKERREERIADGKPVETEEEDDETALPAGPLSTGDFLLYSPEHTYIFRPAGSRWPKATIDGRLEPVATGRTTDKGKKILVKPSAWLDKNQAVDQMTWAPGEPQLIADKLIADGGWIERPGARVFNLFRPANPPKGDPRNAKRWLDHVRLLYPDDADHIISWFAHRCQFPGVKINHSIFLAGAPGIGKDTLIEPLRHTLGHWNCQTVTPTQLIGRFNGFVKCLLMVISEARDLGDINRPQFYEHTKLYTAAPPNVLLVDEKNTHPYYVQNACDVIITSNYKAGGIYLPADDRRTFVAWSDIAKEDFEEGYFSGLWGYFARGGLDAIAAYLMDLDVSEFDPFAPPPQTPAFWDIVNASRSSEASEIEDALDALGRPQAVSIAMLAEASPTDDFKSWINDRRNRRVIPATLEKAGYTNVHNPLRPKDGLWKILGKRQAIYAKTELNFADQIRAARKLQDGSTTYDDKLANQ
jgi:hypothetical protein